MEVVVRLRKLMSWLERSGIVEGRVEREGALQVQSLLLVGEIAILKRGEQGLQVGACLLPIESQVTTVL